MIKKLVSSGYGIKFGSLGSWSFHNDTPRNVIIFSVDHSSSYHADNHKKKCYTAR